MFFYTDFLVFHLLRLLMAGGVRGAAFIHSPLLASKGRVSLDLMHVTDWLPTLYELAGGNSSMLRNVDGYNMWDTLSKGKKSPRQELLHNIYPSGGEAAMRYGQWKIVVNAGIFILRKVYTNLFMQLRVIKPNLKPTCLKLRVAKLRLSSGKGKFFKVREKEREFFFFLVGGSPENKTPQIWNRASVGGFRSNTVFSLKF